MYIFVLKDEETPSKATAPSSFGRLIQILTPALVVVLELALKHLGTQKDVVSAYLETIEK